MVNCLPVVLVLAAYAQAAPAVMELTLLEEGKFRDIIDGAPKHLEASSVTQVGGQYYAIFDSKEYVGVVSDIQNESSRNYLAGKEGDDIGYEGLQYISDGQFMALIEADDKYGVINEFTISGDEKSAVRTCKLDYKLPSNNKGFEGIYLGRLIPGEPQYLFALCEGNYCENGDTGETSGNGRIQVFEVSATVLEGDDDDDGGGDECLWKHVQEIQIPPQVSFTDYSDFDFNGTHIAIVSQEDSTLWIGSASVVGPNMTISDDGVIYSFPKNEDDDVIYCNIEGVVMNGNTVVVVSDKAKGDQDDECEIGESSIHRFQL
ncbi:hypothetical protein SARC_02805 [Sphaeroforma arctica JP610]|uniref:Phytase-like domain-containing protein n=1 Tax=Sphaeroforma arctica JP610 TaxID=667725 RepID=A0A0L0G7T0_9EUKA|nr:hypothetical protein SARC_02805 [Sphaeroforma arctica JP610]KNC84984.1 hypothetical protein SARC_02805 [Sphaeroforma arctica JP610]|eukprot:XP_014158886.1 hypothetical protein SARC_02805 [Sphaeroforma arctica JP610]